ncbi:MAG: class I SAM-dependent methyltransferase [Myxococcota bacterium]
MFTPEGPTLLELAAQALSSTERGYDMIAPRFDATPFRTPDLLLEPMVKALGAPGSVACALDVCCGTGAVLGHLRPLCRSYVTGIDFSTGMLSQARERFCDEQDGGAEVRLVQGDVLAMPFEEEFDLVATCGALGHFEPHQHDALVGQIFKALKPGGRFACVARRPLTPRERTWWYYQGFNAVMRVRNTLLKPPFVMYYLQFNIHRALDVLTRQGFLVEVLTPFAPPHDPFRLVVGTRPLEGPGGDG